jgi:hypothetical protein
MLLAFSRFQYYHDFTGVGTQIQQVNHEQFLFFLITFYTAHRYEFVIQANPATVESIISIDRWAGSHQSR